MATYTSNNYEGRYLQLDIFEVTNAISNTSTLYWTLSSVGGAVNYYAVAPTTVKINGETVYYKDLTPWDSRVFPAAKGSVSGSIDVTHDSDGSKSIYVEFSTRVYYYTPVDYGGTLLLTKIDRSAPSISISTSNITASSVYLSATSSTICDIWEYTTDNWVTYSQYATGGRTSANITITGLSPNTNYTIAVRARKLSNHVVGYSGTQGIKTLGGSVISSVNDIAADESTVSITLKATVYDSSYTHTVKILNGSTTLVTISGISLSSGVSKTINLSSAQRTTLLNAMPNVKTLPVVVQLLTYSGSSQIGTSSKNISLTTSSSVSAPVFNSFTYLDTNPISVGVTGDDQTLIQTVSNLVVTAEAATSKNGASISSYQVAIGDKVSSSTTTTISVGSVNSTGTVPMIVTAIDSRGYTSSATVNVTVVKYEKINISSLVMRRINEIEPTCEVDIYGTFSPVTVLGEDKNFFQHLYVRYKKTNESSYSSWISINGVESTSNSFSYSSDEFLTLTLDADYSYNVQFYASDKLDSDIETVTIPQGTPLLSFRQKKIGLNKRNPQAAFDVGGQLKVEGSAVFDDSISVSGTSTLREIVPSATATYNIGSSLLRWNNVYSSMLNVSGVSTLGEINSYTITPRTTTTYNLGSSTYRWNYVYAQYLNISSTCTFSGSVNISGSTTLSSNLTARNIYFPADNTYDVGSHEVRPAWVRCVKLAVSDYINGATAISGDFNPATSYTHSLGNSSRYWYTGYISGIYYDTMIKNSDRRVKNDLKLVESSHPDQLHGKLLMGTQSTTRPAVMRDGEIKETTTNYDIVGEDILDFIKSLNVYTYVYDNVIKAKGNEETGEVIECEKRETQTVKDAIEHNRLSDVQIGILADEIQDHKLFPYVGYRDLENEDGLMAVKYDNLVVLSLYSNKELLLEIEKLKREIQELKGEI
jgi:hypothetical protein